MAYNRGDRFPRLPYPVRFLEPGTYQNLEAYNLKLNKAPFLAKCERKTQPGNKIWTHAIYDADPQRRIPNCASLMSKRPRFPYEALSAEDIEAMLCRCGRGNICECKDKDEEDPEAICDAKIHKRLFKGPPPRAGMEGLSVPSRRDFGFEEMPDGTFKRIFKTEVELGPTFYNSKVYKSTDFYHGCKWSKWKSSRTIKALESRPGPADYDLVRMPTENEICAEQVRAERRKYSKQLRYIEMIQQKNTREGRPGPASYSPKESKGTDLSYYGSKAQRFKNYTDAQNPGPCAHWIKRDFDLLEPPPEPCLARLPDPAFFGVKAKRFKPQKEEGPSPASYGPCDRQCHVLNCSTAPFGSSARRFKETALNYDDDTDEDVTTDEKACPKPTWPFKSKTIRMKPLGNTRRFEQIPADFPMVFYEDKRPNQHLCPFYSSEGRFEPWYDWLAVYARLKTPGPGYYNPEKYRCTRAVCRGPLLRAERFSPAKYQSPAPNEYYIRNGVETIFHTFNQRLNDNMVYGNKVQWRYVPPKVQQKLSFFDREGLILDKAILALDVESETREKPEKEKETPDSERIEKGVIAADGKQKLLRTFLYKQAMKPIF